MRRAAEANIVMKKSLCDLKGEEMRIEELVGVEHTRSTKNTANGRPAVDSYIPSRATI